MSEIITTKVIVLKKIDYGDSSKIATFFSPDNGKISAIIKGAKSSKSKSGSIIDPLNILEITYYNKPNRDIQIVSQSDLVFHPSKIVIDLDKLKFASAAIELTDKLIYSNQSIPIIFRATEKLLRLINESEFNPGFLFAKYFLFFLKEIGYEPQIENCIHCGTVKNIEQSNHFNFEIGLVCDNCAKTHLTSISFDRELFKFLNCLSHKNNDINFTETNLNKVLFFLEKYLMHHVSEFKGLNSLKMF